jgi:hypothetical protein
MSLFFRGSLFRWGNWSATRLFPQSVSDEAQINKWVRIWILIKFLVWNDFFEEGQIFRMRHRWIVTNFPVVVLTPAFQRPLLFVVGESSRKLLYIYIVVIWVALNIKLRNLKRTKKLKIECKVKHIHVIIYLPKAYYIENLITNTECPIRIRTLFLCLIFPAREISLIPKAYIIQAFCFLKTIHQKIAFRF